MEFAYPGMLCVKFGMESLQTEDRHAEDLGSIACLSFRLIELKSN